MKKGKTARIIGIKNAKVIYGTVNSIEFKSVYLNIQTWVDPKKDSQNWQRVVLNLSREIKHAIHEKLDRNLFEEKFIVDLDLRSSGLSLGKKSFANLEINLFLRVKDLDFKSSKLKDSLKKIMKNVFDSSFTKNEYFEFYLTKNSKNTKSEENL
jgi:hypothetical protein